MWVFSIWSEQRELIEHGSTHDSTLQNRYFTAYTCIE
nr:MAG TPA: hypothetical protein [Caudoviricetes sp.]